MTAVGEIHGHAGLRYKPGCGVCRSEAAARQRVLRARKRDLVRPALPAGVAVDAPGPVVAAVEAELARLGDLTGWQGLAAAAVALARIFDSGSNVPTWPAAAKQLAALLGVSHRQVASPRGRLSLVQAMTDGRAP